MLFSFIRQIDYRILALVLVFSIILPWSNSSAGLFDDKIDEAEKLIKLSGYEKQAHDLLQQAIIDDPSSAKTLFRAGEAYEKMGWSNEADKAYVNAYRIDNKYGEKIATKYFSLAIQAMQSKNESEAISQFDKALSFNPTPKFKKKITDSTVSFAEQAFNSGAYRSAKRLLRFSSQIDPALAGPIGGMYLEAANKSLQSQKLAEAYELYSDAIKYNSSLSAGIESTIFEEGKKRFTNGQFKIAESVFAIGGNLNQSFSDRVLKLYMESLNLTSNDLEKMIKEYYDQKGEWTGIFEIEYIEKIKIENIANDQRYVHAKYRYRAIPGNPKGRKDSGFDQRIFVLKKAESGYGVVSMLQYNSAKF